MGNESEQCESVTCDSLGFCSGQALKADKRTVLWARMAEVALVGYAFSTQPDSKWVTRWCRCSWHAKPQPAEKQKRNSSWHTTAIITSCFLHLSHALCCFFGLLARLFPRFVHFTQLVVQVGNLPPPPSTNHAAQLAAEHKAHSDSRQRRWM